MMKTIEMSRPRLSKEYFVSKGGLYISIKGYSPFHVDGFIIDDISPVKMLRNMIARVTDISSTNDIDPLIRPQGSNTNPE